MRAVVSFLLILSFALPLSATTGSRIEIKEWPLPWPDTKPSAPYVQTADLVWFAGEGTDLLGTLNPHTGVFKRADLIDGPKPRSLAVTASGMVWFAGTLHGYIGRFDPLRRTIWHASMPNSAVSDPSYVMLELGERNVWFTATSSNAIGRLRMQNGIVDLIGVPTPNAQPERLTSALDGTPWIALAGTSAIASVDPRTFNLTVRALPRKAARPRQLAFSSDGRLWYVDFAEGYLGMFESNSTTAKEWPLPGGKASKPAGLAVDDQSRVWIIEAGVSPNKLINFDTKTEKFISTTSLPAAGGAVQDMQYNRASGELWFSTDKNAVGVAKIG